MSVLKKFSPGQKVNISAAAHTQNVSQNPSMPSQGKVQGIVNIPVRLGFGSGGDFYIVSLDVPQNGYSFILAQEGHLS